MAFSRFTSSPVYQFTISLPHRLSEGIVAMVLPLDVQVFVIDKFAYLFFGSDYILFAGGIDGEQFAA
ncbi:MAG: hypothetical protein KBS40_02475 [Bacteroidales bacterium]|nr:hypothetical protein [Bacteroidales bacterium]